MIALIKRLFRIGHHSVLEHISLTFAIAGISRVCSHQLVRHRLASYSQQSQRYVKQLPEFVIPNSLKGSQDFKEELKRIHNLYLKMAKSLKKEDARYIIPNAQTTNIIMTMNLRELIHASSLRLCNRAQWEIRQLFQKIKAEVKHYEPVLARFLKPRCFHLGFCPEIEPCGKYDWVVKQ